MTLSERQSAPDEFKPQVPYTKAVSAFLHVIVGILAGMCLGIVATIVLYYYMLWEDPVNMKQGGGTPFPYILLMFMCAGTVQGAIWGYRCAFPAERPKSLTSKMTHVVQVIAAQPAEVQRWEIERFLPGWLREFRQTTMRYIATVVLSLLISRSFPPSALVALYFTLKLIWLVWVMRSETTQIRVQWGDSIFDKCEHLPFLLRVWN